MGRQLDPETLLWTGHHFEEETPTTQTLASSESLLELHSLINSQKCDLLVEGVRKYATSCINSRGTNHGGNGLLRIPRIAAASRAETSNTTCARPLDEETDYVASCILEEVLAVLDTYFPTLVQTLFATCSVDNELHTSVSLTQMLRNDQLYFASREPAINLYREGGKFHAHTDGQKLTILIPLTDGFAGGGTAFWACDKRHRLDPPSVIVKPPRGTVLLFGGHVTHCGLPVEKGERIVLVASFSPKTPSAHS